MPPLPMTGEIKFSAIGQEFEDEYSLTDDTKTIRLSHYYKDINHIPTNHISKFPTTFNPFKLSLFRGEENESSIVIIPPSPIDAQSTITSWSEDFSNSGIEWLDGVTINNNRNTQQHAKERLEPINDINRGKVSTRDDRRSQIIHARSGDTLTITGKIKVSSYAEDTRRISGYYKGPNNNNWITFATSNGQPGNATHTITFSNFPPVGIYAIVIAGYYNNYYGSQKKYTLEIW